MAMNMTSMATPASRPNRVRNSSRIPAQPAPTSRTSNQRPGSRSSFHHRRLAQSSSTAARALSQAGWCRVCGAVVASAVANSQGVA